MLRVDQVRGLHSTGVCTVSGAGSQSVMKKAVHSTDFLDMKTADNMINALGNKAIIGHNRYATKGAVNTQNAHPFTSGGITGVHNGTLTQQSLLDDWGKFEVDSENIMHCLNKNGIDDTVKKLCGAFTLVWHNSKTDTFHMVRNSQRPMHYAYTKDGNSMLYASEEWMVLVAAHKNNLKIGQCTELPVGKLLSISLSEYNSYKERIGSRATLKELELYKAPVVQTNKTWNNGIGTKKRFILSEVKKDSRLSERKTYTGFTEEGQVARVFTHTKGQHLKLDVVYEGYPSTVAYTAGEPVYGFSHYTLKAVKEIGKGKPRLGSY